MNKRDKENVFEISVKSIFRCDNASQRGLVQACPSAPPPSNSLRLGNLVAWKLGIDRGLIDLTALVASTAPSLITNPLLIAFKWDDVPWMAAFRFVRKKEKEGKEEAVSTPRWSRRNLSFV